MIANRGIYDRGWVACTTPRRLPWTILGGTTDNPADDFAWELYHVDADFSESVNLARSNPRKLRELQDLWWAEAARHNVLPLDCRFGERANPANRPSLSRGRTTFTYYPGIARIPEATAPDVKNKSFRLTAEVEMPEGGAEGVLVTEGGRGGGWGLLVLDSKPAFVYAWSNQPQHKFWVAADEKPSPARTPSPLTSPTMAAASARRHRRTFGRWPEGGRAPHRADRGQPLHAGRNLRRGRGHGHAGGGELCRKDALPLSPAR